MIPFVLFLNFQLSLHKSLGLKSHHTLVYLLYNNLDYICFQKQFVESEFSLHKSLVLRHKHSLNVIIRIKNNIIFFSIQIFENKKILKIFTYLYD